VHTLGAPVVIKATGLAAGKGVVVASTTAEAERAIDDLLSAHTLGAAGDEILVEEFMHGEELSLFALTDGTHAIALVPAQDHKRLAVGDAGPNTGGMGAYAPVSLATPALVERAMREIVMPTLETMRAHGTPFRGLLYAGLMLTPDGPRVVEFNCRFGDPETQAVLPILRGSLLDAMLAVARGDSIEGGTLSWDGTHAVTTVVAAQGYPGTPRLGDPITLPALPPNAFVFHAGTALDASGRLVTAGGRVLALTATAHRFAAAQAASSALASSVTFEGKHFRTDIGWRERDRLARPATGA
jgi:phosphoribosylamine--glycine ligase